ncbi:cytoplasmic Dnase [Marinomonas rhizomae]|uniref:Sec-independent protein translocase TatD n=1 Tax=Marinomonas rhizomae TaxID=491948 RepID=A0A366JCK9_9GAMM|nr:TatD family hydrolase [Marinomonas rhizomae]RBP84731.1 Sec-independent protein translocase TatD [Marinomonas rhizomae]RNF75070.1 cytoplasmic Dnase [Marinomonas rhizomae]
MIDIGVNINHRHFLDDMDQTFIDMQEVGVKGMICIASDLQESRKIQTLSQNHSAMWNTIGCHPHQAKTWDKESKSHFSELILSARPVAIGETGLDFNRNYSTPKEQIFAFDEQIELATEHKLPLYLHERDAHKEMVEILKQHPNLAQKSVIHCFTGSRTELDQYLELGLFIGITGWVCDERRGSELQAAVPHIPLDRLLIETDAPYLLPRTIRPRPKKNHPKYLPWVAQEVARLKGISIEELTKATEKNTDAIFGIRV